MADGVKASTTIGITLPVELWARLERRRTAAGHRNASEYFHELVQRDLEDVALRRLRDMLAEGMASGPGRDFDDDFRNEIRSKAGLPDK